MSNTILFIFGAVIVGYFIAATWRYGFLRPTFTLLSLAAGVYIGFWSSQYASVFLEMISVSPEPVTVTLFGAAIGIVAFLFLRKLCNALLGATFDIGTGYGRIFAGPVGVLIGLVPLILILVFSISALRAYATLAEIKHTDDCVAEFTRAYAAVPFGEETPPPPQYPTLSASVNFRNNAESFPQLIKYLDRIDPISPAARRNLANLIVISKNTELFARLGDSHRVSTLLAVPEIEDAFRDPVVLHLRNKSDYTALLKHPKIIQAAALPETESELQQIDFSVILPKLLTPIASQSTGA
ncbi:MAG: CvpA family protein [Verrucomicrobiota bacterium]